MAETPNAGQPPINDREDLAAANNPDAKPDTEIFIPGRGHKEPNNLDLTRIEPLDKTDKAKKPGKDKTKAPKADSATKPEAVEKTPPSPEQIAADVAKAETWVNETKDRTEKIYEERYGKGLWGKANQFLNNTTLGKTLKIAGKLGLGAIGVTIAGTLTGTAGLLLSPFLFTQGMRQAIEGAGQALQHYGLGGKNRLDAEHCQRELLLAESEQLELIKQLPKDSPERQQAVVDLANKMAQIELAFRKEMNKDIDWDNEKTKQIEKIAKISAIIFSIAHGFPMGTQEFDGDKVEHAVRAGIHGFEFMYKAGETMAQTTHAYLGGAIGHTLGGSVPWQSWVGLGFAAGGMLIDARPDGKVGEAVPSFGLPDWTKQTPPAPLPAGSAAIEIKSDATEKTKSKPAAPTPETPEEAKAVVKEQQPDLEIKQPPAEFNRLKELAELDPETMNLDTALEALEMVPNPTKEPENFQLAKQRYLNLDRKAQLRQVKARYAALFHVYQSNSLVADDPRQETHQKIYALIINARDFLQKETPVDVAEDVVEQETLEPTPETVEKSKQSPETENGINQLIETDLSYADTEPDTEKRQARIAFTLGLPGAKHYAESLLQLSQQTELAQIRASARSLVDTMQAEAQRLDIPIGQYGNSISWAMWDIGKQHYYLTHPEKAAPGYKVGDPLTSDEQRNEIINRHLGWEVYVNKEVRDQLLADNRFRAARTLMRKERPDGKMLSSRDLAELGRRLRLATLEPEASTLTPEELAKQTERYELGMEVAKREFPIGSKVKATWIWEKRADKRVAQTFTAIPIMQSSRGLIGLDVHFLTKSQAEWDVIRDNALSSPNELQTGQVEITDYILTQNKNGLPSIEVNYTQVL